VPDDKMTFRILEDGRVRMETEAISAVNHTSADMFAKAVERLLGGETITQKRAHAHVHAHAHAQRKEDA
jgi:hypothetical protein